MGNQRKKTPKKNPNMENRRKKIQKTSEKNQQERETRPWADLPQEIIVLILGKLLDAVDLIRFRAVCKSWHVDIPKERMIKYKHLRTLPWLCNLAWADHTTRLECEIYDPYSRQIFKTSKVVHGCRYTRFYSTRIEVIGSKQGWLIGTYHHFYMIKKEIIMYNPYTRDFFPLSFTKIEPCYATFSGDPVSKNCRVFLFSRGRVNLHYHENYISSYDLSGDAKEWRVEFVDAKQEECCGMQYMNEQLFCLFKDGVMRRYILADGSWAQVVLGEGSRSIARDNQLLWLAKGEGDLLVACQLRGNNVCAAFYFDWSNMSWVGISDLQESSAVFASGRKIAAFVRPYEEFDDGENNEDCKMYFFINDFLAKDHPSYYTFKEKRKPYLKFYFWSVFIAPPPINN